MQRRKQDENRGKRRVSNACKRCRKHKIKCSGTRPCKTCDNRGIECEFEAEEKKILVSEKNYHDLKRRLAQFEDQGCNAHVQEENTATRSPGETNTERISDERVLSNLEEDNTGIDRDENATQVTSPASGHLTRSSADVVPNPLVSEKAAFTRDMAGRLRYLGHSSTWSFSRQVLEIAQRFSPMPHPSMNVEGEAYNLDWKLLPHVNFSGLPSFEVSIYLLQTVKFRICSLFHLFDEDDFNTNMQLLYANPMQQEGTPSLWFVQYLIIIAFGKAFVNGGHAGSELFTRALRLMPDTPICSLHPILSTEILCAMALYFQCIDYRSSAHIYIGQAVRMAESHGLHTNMQAELVGDTLTRRCRKIWWTVYTLDRRFSALMGASDFLRDEEITVPLSSDSDFDPGFVIYVKISQLFGKVIHTVYSMGGKLNKTFISNAQTVLRGASGLANELTEFSDSRVGEISRVAAHLKLAYHQCIILTTRPFLFHFLCSRLESPESTAAIPLSASAKGLLQVCVDSAIQMVITLSSLKQHDLLDTFLPFDLDSAFSSAFVLLMAPVVSHKLSQDQSKLEILYQVLDFMCSQGNLLAKLRKSEVEELSFMLSDLSHRTSARNLQTGQPQLTPLSNTRSSDFGEHFFQDWNMDDNLPGSQLMNLADMLNNDDLTSLWLEDELPQSSLLE